MPEGPEVKKIAHTLNLSLKNNCLGEIWLSGLKLRKEINTTMLKSRQNMTVTSVDCYGKILFIHTNKQPILMAQMGMTGQLIIEDQSALLKPHTHVRWQIKNTSKELRYIDIRRFGLIDSCDKVKKTQILSKLGPDPFNLDKAGVAKITNSFKKSAKSIKEVLLDQKVLVGVGNIYASEALFNSHINPYTKACDLSTVQAKKLIDSVISILKKAFLNGGTTFSDYVDGDNKKGKNQQFLQVFKREKEPCFICQTNILRIKQSGRSTFFCPSCQEL